MKWNKACYTNSPLIKMLKVIVRSTATLVLEFQPVLIVSQFTRSWRDRATEAIKASNCPVGFPILFSSP